MQATDGDPSVQLDLTGLKCPLPALLVRRRLRTMRPGERVAVSATDALAGIDVPNAAREEGAVVEMVACEPGPVWRFTIRADVQPG